MEKSQVVIVDKNDVVLGFAPKLDAHENGSLHRAVSILIFNSQGDWLIQKRADSKYHSGGLWTNTCCSHPYPYESYQSAAERRLEEEMGMSNIMLTDLFSFQYKAELEGGLIENELDHVFIGFSDKAPVLNSEEASDFKYLSNEELIEEIDKTPEKFTVWFKILVEKFSVGKFYKSKVA